ncbi:F-box/kelch-repeat protein [Cardamine amara subsp. amara]|uniref:F-box/kelch-repeat protein n=1 Tax=Cardamine amara subsp. amara TaxID=228776 RepID=A0ABD0ZBN9_CARAN
MSTLAASDSNEPPQENFHVASSLLSLVKKLLGLLSFSLLQCKLMRRAVNFINRNETVTSTTVLTTDQSSLLLFSSLPEDVILNCLARVPRRYYPIVSCVSKSFRFLVLSPDLAHIRSLMGKDYPLIYVCFTEKETTSLGMIFHWFTFNPKEKQTSGQNNSIQVLSQHKLYCSTVSIGSKIYFVGGSMNKMSSSLWIFDSWSGELREGPSMKVARMLPGVAVVDEKLYVMGGCSEALIQVEVFDLENQTWKVGPMSPHGEIRYGQGLRGYGVIVTEAVASEGKVYGMSYREGSHRIYDTKDGRCETLKMANEDTWRRGGVCVINNVMYVNYSDVGVMWYDSEDKVWKVVKGLKKLVKPIDISVGMLDCNGKLAFLWEDERDVEGKKSEKRIWCAMILLDRSGVEIYGKVEWSDLVGSVPWYYEIWRCLGVSN